MEYLNSFDIFIGDLSKLLRDVSIVSVFVGFIAYLTKGSNLFTMITKAFLAPVSYLTDYLEDHKSSWKTVMLATMVSLVGFLAMILFMPGLTLDTAIDNLPIWATVNQLEDMENASFAGVAYIGLLSFVIASILDVIKALVVGSDGKLKYLYTPCYVILMLIVSAFVGAGFEKCGLELAIGEWLGSENIIVAKVAYWIFWFILISATVDFDEEILFFVLFIETLGLVYEYTPLHVLDEKYFGDMTPDEIGGYLNGLPMGVKLVFCVVIIALAYMLSNALKDFFETRPLKRFKKARRRWLFNLLFKKK